MKTRLFCLSLLAVSGLAACGSEAPPEPAPEPAAPVASAPEPAPPAAAPAPPAELPPNYVPTPTPAPPPDGQQESFITKQAAAAIPAEAIGGSPVTNMSDAWTRGNEALKKYCVDTGLDCASFYTKESPVESGGYWTMQFFGDPGGQGMYIGVRVYPDGRAEIIR